MDYLSPHNGQIARLCSQYKVKKLYAFGSVLTDRFNEDSDVDLIVDFDKTSISDYFVNFFDFKYSLEELLGREVDLIDNHPIRNSFLRKNIETSKTLIYG